MGKRFDQLTLEERCRLRGLLEMGLNKSDIARRLGRHRSTIGRELVRNGLKNGYTPDRAQHMAWVRRKRGSKIERRSRLWRYVEDRLTMGWSPEQIAGRLRRRRSRYAISHETILSLRLFTPWPHLQASPLSAASQEQARSPGT